MHELEVTIIRYIAEAATASPNPLHLVQLSLKREQPTFVKVALEHLELRLRDTLDLVKAAHSLQNEDSCEARTIGRALESALRT